MGSTIGHQKTTPTAMKLRCSTTWMGSVVSVASYSAGMCQTRSTPLKITVADHGFTRSAQARRHRPGGPLTGERIPTSPRMHSGGATIISSRCWTMCTEKRYSSPPTSMGESRATKPTRIPAPKNHGRVRGDPTHALTSSASERMPRRQAST